MNLDWELMKSFTNEIFEEKLKEIRKNNYDIRQKEYDELVHDINTNKGYHINVEEHSKPNHLFRDVFRVAYFLRKGYLSMRTVSVGDSIRLFDEKVFFDNLKEVDTDVFNRERYEEICCFTRFFIYSLSINSLEYKSATLPFVEHLSQYFGLNKDETELLKKIEEDSYELVAFYTEDLPYAFEAGLWEAVDDLFFEDDVVDIYYDEQEICMDIGLPFSTSEIFEKIDELYVFCLEKLVDKWAKNRIHKIGGELKRKSNILHFEKKPD